ncbi:MAG TPA: VOC family protein [Pseudoxanthomonas sp.]
MSHIIPMQPVRHLPRAIVFYEQLGFRVEDRRDDWGWAKLRWGECRVMLDQSINVDPDATRGAVLYLYPDDLDAFHAQARANGLEVPALDTTFYGMREFRIHDPDGNRLWIGQAKTA